jgi:hypothetical protein
LAIRSQHRQYSRIVAKCFTANYSFCIDRGQIDAMFRGADIADLTI